jgi:hypothetical protein
MSTNQGKKHKLPSGKMLLVTPATFIYSKNLYQAFLEELKMVKVDMKTEIDINMFKDLFCSVLASKKIEECLWACMDRVTYDGKKIDEDTFEDIEAREDYIEISIEVAKANIMPFTKTLMQQYRPQLEKLVSSLA